uniref:BRCT domain-containing protein n=1 Tax=Setaria digitata TaxID=48799 RepID=A0A915Q1E5_9BILA
MEIARVKLIMSCSGSEPGFEADLLGNSVGGRTKWKGKDANIYQTMIDSASTNVVTLQLEREYVIKSVDVGNEFTSVPKIPLGTRMKTVKNIAEAGVMFKHKEKFKDIHHSKLTKSRSQKAGISCGNSLEHQTISSKAACIESNGIPGQRKQRIVEEETKKGGLRGIRFALSGYQNPQRSVICDKAKEMGDIYEKDWSSRCTHLVCAFGNIPKYRQVVCPSCLPEIGPIFLVTTAVTTLDPLFFVVSRVMTFELVSRAVVLYPTNLPCKLLSGRAVVETLAVLYVMKYHAVQVDECFPRSELIKSRN